MVFDPDIRFGAWVYGPKIPEKCEENIHEFGLIEGLLVHKSSLIWCDEYLIKKGTTHPPEHLFISELNESAVGV